MIRFCIRDTIGKNVEIFKVEEKKGDLRIYFKNAKKGLSATSENLYQLFDVEEINNNGYLIKENHISVHPNKQNTENNTIKRTIKTQVENECITVAQVTPGMKRDNLFVPIIFRANGSFANNIHNVTQNDKDVNIYLPGNYDLSKKQLSYMIFISHKNVNFKILESHPSNFFKYQFKNYNLYILYSFINLPPLEMFINFTFATSEEMYNNLRGLENFQIYNLFTTCKQIFCNEFFKAKERETND